MAYPHQNPQYSHGQPPNQYQNVGPGGYGLGPDPRPLAPHDEYYGDDGQYYPEQYGPSGAQGPAMRAQSQHRQRPPPQDGYQHDPMARLEQGMRSMTFDNRGPPNRNPNMGGYRGRGYNESDYGNGYHSQGQPRGGWEPSQPGRPPPRMGSRAREGYPQYGQMGHQQQAGYDQRWHTDAEYRGYDGYGYEQQPPAPVQGIQRSMTMPANVNYPHSREPPMPAMQEHQYPAPRETQGVRRVSEAEYGRESVGAFLDSYYDEPESTSQPPAGVVEAPTAPPERLSADGSRVDDGTRVAVELPAEVPAPAQNMNFSRPQPHADHGATHQHPPQSQSNLGVPQQMHKVHSQPEMRNVMPGGYGQEYMTHPGGYGGHEGHSEVAGDGRYMAGYGGHNQGHPAGPMPSGMVHSPVSDGGGMRHPRRVDSVPQRLGSVPPTAYTQRPEDSLPAHPEPEGYRQQGPYPNQNFGLPAHPPPIRPGLVNNGSHPPPQRQYDVEPTVTTAPVEQGPVTHQELEKLSQAVKLNPGDPKLHLTYAKKLVEAATVLASDGGKADMKTTRKNRENYVYEAHKIVKKLTAASNPYPEAIFYLASCYGEGLLGLQIDHEKAYNLYQSAAKLGHGPSAYRTAVCSELGAGVRRDPTKAIQWYKKAASLGETPAMFKLGMIQWKGLLGQPRNPRDGLIWLKRAADQADENNQHALHELALIYERPEGSDVVIGDVSYARELFQKAAELGYPASQFRIASAYEYGTMGCPIDPKKSIAWYSKAAMKGDLESQLALSGWYLTGSDGVLQQSDTEAYLWARKAAERGLAKAEYALGYFTEVGIGVTANMEEAKRWYYKAASQAHTKAQTRLQELKRGGSAAAQKPRERLSRTNVKHKDDGDCVIM
ncbi:HCP-like protein [Ascodesmis nigricans]|uniref:HCP-like protein n=1 Tax=Ascodesmis nigricans TaxID=341454 RepID=A0A4S2MQ09_9PEZI|nr:HCP-like protein [Ascodesmis nigricans]